MPKIRTKHNAIPDETLQAIADDYIEITLRDGFRGVVPKLAAKYDVTYSVMSSRITAARRYGFLEAYVARQCFRCDQPVPRPGMELPALEAFAEDHRELCEKLAAKACEDGNTEMAAQLRQAARHFEKAVKPLVRANDLHRSVMLPLGKPCTQEAP